MHEVAGQDNYLLVMKGAPERIAARCSTMYKGGKVVPFTPEDYAKWEENNTTLGKKGERVLGFCCLELPASQFPKGFNFETQPPNFPLEVKETYLVDELWLTQSRASHTSV